MRQRAPSTTCPYYVTNMFITNQGGRFCGTCIRSQYTCSTILTCHPDFSHFQKVEKFSSRWYINMLVLFEKVTCINKSLYFY